MSTQVDPFVMIPKRVLLNKDLSVHTRFLYGSLLHWDRGRGCWASRETMSNITGLSLYHIRVGIKELVEVGLITEVRRGQGETNVINIVRDFEEVEEEVVETVEDLEVKSFDVSSNIIEGEKKEGEEEETIPSNEIECDEEETLVRSIRYKVKGTERPLIPDGVVVESSTTQIDLYIPSEVWRDHIRDHYLPLVENIVGKKVRIVNKFRGR